MKHGAAREELERKKGALREEIDRLKKELEQRKEQLPAHSIRPHQLLAIEEIEDKIGLKKDQLRLVEERILEGEGSGGSGRPCDKTHTEKREFFHLSVSPDKRGFPTLEDRTIF
jgi:uncharacterized small protein (DUF1192 family)